MDDNSTFSVHIYQQTLLMELSTSKHLFSYVFGRSLNHRSLISKQPVKWKLWPSMCAEVQSNVIQAIHTRIHMHVHVFACLFMC